MCPALSGLVKLCLFRDPGLQPGLSCFAPAALIEIESRLTGGSTGISCACGGHCFNFQVEYTACGAYCINFHFEYIASNVNALKAHGIPARAFGQG